MRQLSLVTMACAGVALCTGCIPTLLTGVVSYPHGGAKTIYSYYLDRRGREVLQGEMLQFAPPGGTTGLATRTVYDHGKLIKGPSECVVNE
ncbi:MAG: hypothetical protein INR62_08285 [Rhodospirillales bacterium]|nr:hypothetical protein [Acetobacter sp.]